MKVLLADKLSPVVRDYLTNESHEMLEDSSLKDDTLMEALQTFQPNVLVVRSTKVTGEHIKQCPSLSLVIRAGAGVNTIDLIQLLKKVYLSPTVLDAMPLLWPNWSWDIF